MLFNPEPKSDLPVLLTDLFQQAAGTHPRKTAVVQGANRISYQDLSMGIEAIARDLKKMGVAAGSLVGLRFPNSIAYIALTYAVWKCGGAVIPIAMELPEAEVDLVCERLAPRFLISERPVAGAVPMACSAPAVAWFFLEQGVAGEAGPTLKDLAFIRFTSGTTGAFKGVALTHRSIVDRITALNGVLEIDSNDTVVWLLSMAHHFVSTIVLYLSQAATIILVSGVPVDSIIRAVETERATILYAAPFHYSLLAADPSQRMLPTLRLAISTTIALPETVFSCFYNRYSRPIVQAYGIIETGLICVNTDQPLAKQNSVGKAVPGYTIEIRNPVFQEGKEAPCGRLFVKGPGFFNAYFSPFRSGGDLLQDGWFDTGDVGRLDQDGFVYILGREKDLINVAGMKVFPQEVETLLDEHPGVKESRVFGMEGAGHGEMVAADVVPASISDPVSAKELRAHCRSRIAAYKVPEKIRFVERIERTAVTSKIVRCRPAAQAGHETCGVRP